PLFVAYREPEESEESEQDGVVSHGASHRNSTTNGISAGNRAQPNGAPTPIFDRLASAWFDASVPNRTPDHDENTEVQWPPPAADEYDDATDNDDVLSHGGMNRAQPESARAREEAGSTSAETTGGPDASNSGNGPTLWTFRADNAHRRAEEVSSAQPTRYT